MNMDLCQNLSVSSGECHQKQVFEPSSSLDDLFSAQHTEVDVGMEWLSVFVEDCFSSPPSCVFVPSSVQASTTISKPSSNTLKRQREENESPLQNFTVPGKARSKRKRLSAPRSTKDPLSIWSHHLNPQNEPLISDPPLLKQTYWLADSELIVPKEKHEQDVTITKEGDMVKEVIVRKESFGESEINGGNVGMARRCSHCLAQRTPQWRAGPLGPKTLCNACGVRYKSGRLLPEYRPAKSPTFVSYLHSNSHKKVMEMRNMAVLSSSISSDDQ